jgi:uncharacterized protein (DUF2225 family)
VINFSALKDISRVKKYPQGTVVCAGGRSGGMIVVLKGQVGVYSAYRTPDERLVNMLGPGGLFGEKAFFLGKDEAAAAVAMQDVIALPIEGKAAASFFRDEPGMALELAKEICARLEAVCAAYDKLNGHAHDGPAHVRKPASARAEQKKGTLQESPAPVAAQGPAPAATAPPDGGAAVVLFPEGHGRYELALHNEDRTYLMDREYTCPICKTEFKTLAVRSSRLVQESTDSDMRHRYKGVEPLYYDAVACPNCLYGALTEMFSKPDNPKADLRELQALKPSVPLRLGAQMDTDSVFASYYLALHCAPKCFLPRRLATAKLHLKLSRIYQDCGDARMEEIEAQHALDDYLQFYLKEESDPSQDQQICVVLGELNLKLGDIRNARDYFFKAKTNRQGSPILRDHAENRLSAIREMEMR